MGSANAKATTMALKIKLSGANLILNEASNTARQCAINHFISPPHYQAYAWLLYVHAPVQKSC